MGFLLNPRRAVEIVAVLGLGVVLASAAAFVRCPGVQFSVAVRATGFQARVGTSGDTSRIRGLLARKVTWEPLSTGNATSNDLLSPRPGSNDPLTGVLEASDQEVVELAELALPDESRLDLRLSIDRHRRPYLDLEVEPPKGKHATTIFVRPPGGHGADPRVTTHAPRYRFFEPELVGDSLLPLHISGALLSARVPSGNATYPISLVSDGVVQFFHLDRPVSSQSLTRGDILMFEGLDAELRTLAIEDGVLTLRIFGTARDVKFGAGSAVSSIYPTLFDGWAAQPWLAPLLGTVTGIVLAWFGVLAGAGPRPNSPD